MDHQSVLDAYNAVQLAKGALDTAQVKLDIAMRHLTAVLAPGLPKQ
jgi:hypothetical protein